MDFIKKALLTNFLGPKSKPRSIPELDRLLEERLKALPESLKVDTRAFIQAIQEIERQEEIRAYSMFKAIQTMESQLETLKAHFYSRVLTRAKYELCDLYPLQDIWPVIFNEDTMTAWHKEAEDTIKAGYICNAED